MSTLWKTYLITLIIYNNVQNESIAVVKKKKEASEIKLAEIVREHIKDLYLNLINAHVESVINILIKIFELISKNGEKSHKKGKKTVFDILGVSYRSAGEYFVKTA